MFGMKSKVNMEIAALKAENAALREAIDELKNSLSDIIRGEIESFDMESIVEEAAANAAESACTDFLNNVRISVDY